MAETKVLSGLCCVDLSNPDINQLKQACMETGFFYVINHGISEELRNEVFSQSKKFFELPLNVKLEIVNKEKHRGYHRPARAAVDPETNQKGHGEAYRIGDEVPEGDPDAEKPYYGPNVWPPADILPGWKESMERYHREMLGMGRAVARLIALALGLNVDFFDQPKMLGKPISNLYLMHYEVTELSKELLGLPPHSDYGLITLLATEDVFGLQICRDRHAEPRQWEYVPTLKGAFIVNIADMLERLSNCVFRSSLHRVLFRQERYSISLFLYPYHDGVLECLPTCMSDENPPKFPPITCGEFLTVRFKEVAEERKKNIIQA